MSRRGPPGRPAARGQRPSPPQNAVRGAAAADRRCKGPSCRCAPAAARLPSTSGAWKVQQPGQERPAAVLLCCRCKKVPVMHGSGVKISRNLAICWLRGAAQPPITLPPAPTFTSEPPPLPGGQPSSPTRRWKRMAARRKLRRARAASCQRSYHHHRRLLAFFCLWALQCL